jgi:glycosyltransferase involved in cell wall biosynthesis
MIAPEPFYQSRGTPIALWNVIRALGELGYGIDLVTYPVGNTIELPGLRIYRAANPFRINRVGIGFSGRKILLDIALAVAVAARVRRQHYAYVHAVEEAVVIALATRRWHRAPVVYDMHSCIPDELASARFFRSSVVASLLRRLERSWIRSVDRIACSAGLGGYVKRQCSGADVSEWRFPAQTASVSETRVAELREQLGIPAGAFVIVYAGNFEPYQGVSTLIKVAEWLRTELPSAVMVLVGARRKSDRLLTAGGRELEQSGALKIVSSQPRDEIPAYLALADVLVSARGPTPNVPLKIFDYLAAGKAIVATDVANHRGILDETRGVLVPGNARAMGEAIASLARDDSRAKALGAAARSYAEERLGWSGFVESVRQLAREPLH